MQKIINRRRYNTETAACVATWRNGYGKNDFKNCRENMYRTPSGNFFIYGEGGAMTRWGEHTPYGRCDGRGIEALTKEEAVAWLEQHEMDIPSECPELEKLITEA